MKIFQNKINKSNNIKIVGFISILAVIIISLIYFLIYQPNQKQNDLEMELKCKEIAENLYEKIKVSDNMIGTNILTQYGFNRKLNTCIYVEEITWQEDANLYFLFKVMDSIRNQSLLYGYNSNTYQKDIYKDHRKEGQEITADEYNKIKEELLDNK